MANIKLTDLLKIHSNILYIYIWLQQSTDLLKIYALLYVSQQFTNLVMTRPQQLHKTTPSDTGKGCESVHPKLKPHSRRSLYLLGFTVHAGFGTPPKKGRRTTVSA